MPLRIHPAKPEDAEAMCDLINPIIAEGTTTAHRTRFDAHRMRTHYIAPPRLVSCVTAWESARLTGFQTLEWPDPDWTEFGTVPANWGLIASFVARGAQRRGIGRAMFAATRKAARAAGMVAIDATIRADNGAGLGYYARLGFLDFDRVTGVPLSDGLAVDRIRKVYAILPQV